MTVLSKSFSDIFNDYKSWISQNPSKVRVWESRICLIAQVLLDRFKSTRLQGEWLRSAYRLISLFNGLIILHSSTKKPYENSERVNICVAILEHCEIALEKSAEQLWGGEGRLRIVTYLQLMKFLARMTLVLHFKQKVIGHPCAELENSKVLQQQSNGGTEYANSDNVLRLKRSGRIMRTVASAPPLCSRVWKPPVMDIPVSPFLKSMDEEEKMVQAVAEMLYIIKPIVSLALMKKFGHRNWKQWTISLFLDVLSLHLLEYPSKDRQTAARFTPVETSIIGQRRRNLLLYLIRSPFFLTRIANPLYLILYMIPYFGPTLSSELRFHLTSYFFLWSK